MGELQPHQQRVVDEKLELDTRRVKLLAFIGDVPGPIYRTLPEAEQARLRKQARLMQELSDVLAERIAAFN